MLCPTGWPWSSRAWNESCMELVETRGVVALSHATQGYLVGPESDDFGRFVWARHQKNLCPLRVSNSVVPLTGPAQRWRSNSCHSRGRRRLVACGVDRQGGRKSPGQSHVCLDACWTVFSGIAVFDGCLAVVVLPPDTGVRACEKRMRGRSHSFSTCRSMHEQSEPLPALPNGARPEAAGRWSCRQPLGGLHSFPLRRIRLLFSCALAGQAGETSPASLCALCTPCQSCPPPPPAAQCTQLRPKRKGSYAAAYGWVAIQRNGIPVSFPSHDFKCLHAS